MQYPVKRPDLPIPSGRLPAYLTQSQVNALTRAFQDWYDGSSAGRRKQRGRYWLTYLVLRFTGARIGEVLMLNDTSDINFREAEIRMPTLKRRQLAYRQVFVPQSVVAEIATYLAEFPEMRGKVFRIYQSNFRRTFYERAKEAGIPRELAHPHVLRHTRAIELLRAGVPITIVQDQLGHAYLTTTAVYLKLSGQEAKQILRERGLL